MSGIKSDKCIAKLKTSRKKKKSCASVRSLSKGRKMVRAAGERPT